METRILESSCPCHHSYNLVEGNVLAEMSDTASQLSVLMKGDKGSALLQELRRERRRVRDGLTVKTVANAIVGYLLQDALIVLRQREALFTTQDSK